MSGSCQWGGKALDPRGDNMSDDTPSQRERERERERESIEKWHVSRRPRTKRAALELSTRENFPKTYPVYPAQPAASVLCVFPATASSIAGGTRARKVVGKRSRELRWVLDGGQHTAISFDEDRRTAERVILNFDAQTYTPTTLGKRGVEKLPQLAVGLHSTEERPTSTRTNASSKATPSARSW